MSPRPARMQIPAALALITGAGSGIGQATAEAFARKGASVLCADLNGESAEKTAATCSELGAPSTAAYVVDVADRDALEALASRIDSERGPLDIVVNNAGVGMSGRFTDMSAQDWTWIRSINLDGVVNGCAVFGPGLLERGRGHVVNLSSGLGFTPTATEPAYVTTKAAVLALSQCLRADWSRSGVGVSAICPGVINTPIISATRFVGPMGTDETRDKTSKIFRRGHRPEKVAEAIVGAIEHNKAVVPVGIESRIGWYLHRLAPIGLQQVIARAGAHR
ncbi:MAG: SDR family NAD(P)-dependent oxidoreductase [Acidimicrobiales bacterium]